MSTHSRHAPNAAVPIPTRTTAFTFARNVPTSGMRAPADEAGRVYRDSAGNILQDGDTVTVIKDLKLKGSSKSVKIGTRVKNIRLVDSDHDIDCKVDGFGAMSLKSEFVKKV